MSKAEIVVGLLSQIFCFVSGLLLGGWRIRRKAQRDDWQAVRDTDARTKAFMRAQSMEDRIPTTSSVADPAPGRVRVRRADWRHGDMP